MTRIECLKPSIKGKFVKDSINDYHSLLNFLMRFYPNVLKEFQKKIGRPIKTGLRIGYKIINLRGEN